MKILVTGGAGFIGSNFIRQILRTRPDTSVLNLDKLTYAGNCENLSEVESNPNYKFYKGDICDPTLVAELLGAKFDAVVHFAAESHVDRSIADAREFIHTNVQGTYTLLDAARRQGVERFLHVSTDEVYGSMHADESADELSLLQPNSPYAASKAASDLVVRSFWQTYKYPVMVTRSSNNYGPHQFPEKLIPLMITNTLEGKKLPVYGDGLQERDWIYVEDHCRALDRVLHSGRPGETYNIGYGHPEKNLDIVRNLLRILDKPESLIEYVADRPGHDRRYALNTSKIAHEMGWSPSVALKDGLAKTVEWYRANSEWVRKTKSGEYRSYYKKFYDNRPASLAQL
ncbi:MAG TPA: dTDP-glucose 4,6-dehydratase [Terriglobia bacterium]|nr:dTDP-glucose 4,6-dehydratase [Terriglobia bacterium]